MLLLSPLLRCAACCRRLLLAAGCTLTTTSRAHSGCAPHTPFRLWVVALQCVEHLQLQEWETTAIQQHHQQQRQQSAL